MSSVRKIKKLVCILLVVSLMLAMQLGGFAVYADSGTQTNLVLNPSFETGSTKPDNWTFTSANTAGTWSWDTGKSYDGQKSIKFTTPGTNDRAVFTQQYLSIEPDTKYKLSVFYCANNDQVQPSFNIYWYTADKVLISTKYVNGIKGALDWTKLELENDMPVNAALALIQLQSKGSGTVWFDLAELTEVPRSYNLAANPGFEAGAASPDNWSFTSIDTGGTWAWDTSVKYDGEKSVKLTTVNDVDKSRFTQQYIPVTPGDIYDLTARYCTENMVGQPSIAVSWFSTAAFSSFISTKSVNCIKDAAGWTEVVLEGVAPANAHFAQIYVQTRSGAGSSWFDDICFRDIKIQGESGAGNAGVLNPGFEEGSTDPLDWEFVNDRTNGDYQWDSSTVNSGTMSVRLSVYGTTDTAYIFQNNIQAIAKKTYKIKTYYKTDNTNATPFMKAYWYDLDGAYLSSSCIEAPPSSDWSQLSLQAFVPEGTAKFALQLGIEGGIGDIWFDDVTVDPILVNYAGIEIPVTGVEDICEPMDPSEFWSEMPEAELTPQTSTIWTKSVLRNFFFGPIEGEEGYQRLTLPQQIEDRDSTIPVLNNTIGAAIDPAIPLAKAGDIQYQPFVKAHDLSQEYYARREHDYLMLNYNPAYVMTCDTSFRTRAEELLQFLQMSQWTAEGTNQFTSTYYPSEYQQHPEWYGGWDYLFDWNWLDSYGYTWSLHEPDHPGNSAVASAMVNSFEIYGDEDYLQMARDYVYNQTPRYGFHKGVWNNETYYWTEYNPTGASLGNPVDDATDNVVALVAANVAKVGYYESDQTLKKQMLEYSRGLLWYMVREYQTDGRWYYHGSENPLNLNNNVITHDEACVLSSFIAMAYLSKAGVNIDTIMQGFEPVLEDYINMWGWYQRKAYMQVVKLYDGVPAPDTSLKFSTFVQVTTDDLNSVKFNDTISQDFIRPENVNLRISHILPPDDTSSDWTVDPDQDVVLSVSSDQLEEGVEIPFPMNKWEVYKLTYELTTTSTFDRMNAADTDSGLSAWMVDAANDATFVRSTSGSTGYAPNSFTLPLDRQTNINSANFLSFEARKVFPFSEEVSAVLDESAAPEAAEYTPEDNWGIFNANRYIYPVQSLSPEVESNGKGLSNEQILDKGKIYNSTAVGDYVEFEFETFRPSVEYTVLTNYLAAGNRSTVKLMLDGVQLGNEYDQYSFASQPTGDIDNGTAVIDEGKHRISFTVTGKNASSNGYAIGLYNALVLVPSSDLDNDASLAALSVGDQAIENFTPDKLEYSVKLKYRSLAAPEIKASANDSNASLKITPAGELPGVAVISVIAEDGITVNNYKIEFSLQDPSIQSVKSLVDTYGKDGGIKGPLMSQLTNSLDQAEQQLDKGDAGKAAKHVEDFLKHLDNPDMSQYITGTVKRSLEIEAKALKEFLLK